MTNFKIYWISADGQRSTETNEFATEQEALAAIPDEKQRLLADTSTGTTSKPVAGTSRKSKTKRNSRVGCGAISASSTSTLRRKATIQAACVPPLPSSREGE